MEVIMKKIHYFFLIFSLIAVTHHAQSSLGNLFGATNTQINNVIKSMVYSNKRVRDTINDHFHKKEQELLQKIKIKFAINNYLWSETRRFADDLVHHDPLYTATDMIAHDPNDHPFIIETRELIADYGMNPNCVLVRDSSKTPLAEVLTTIIDDSYLTHTMDLNISALAKLSDAERRLTIKHEIRHLWYADSLYSSTIEWFISYNRLDPLYIEYSKNQELRADIMAATDSVQDAYELYYWLANCIPDDTDDFIHPIFSKRRKAAERLYTYLKIEADCINAA